MIRRINNLERLHNKLLARYGADDTLVLQLKREMEAETRAKESRPAASNAHAWPGRNARLGGDGQRAAAA